MNSLPQITPEPNSRERQCVPKLKIQVNLADGGHFEFWALINCAHTFARVTPAKVFIEPS